MKKKHKLLKTIIVLVILGGIGFGGYMWLRDTAETARKEAELANEESAVVERRDLVKVVSATGKVASADSKLVAPRVTGVKVSEINIEVGDRVKEGDVIALLDTSTLQESLDIANSSLKTAKQSANLSINSAQRRVNEAKESEVLSAQDFEKRITDAEENIRKYEDLRDQAKNLYDSAVESQDSINERYVPVATAYSELEAVKNSITTLNTQIEEAEEEGDMVRVAELRALRWAAEALIPEREKARDAAEAEYGLLLNLRNALDQAKNAANAQLANYNSYITQVESLEASLDSLKKTKDDTARANASTVQTTEESLRSARISANAGVDQTKLQIETYEEQIEACTVTAPFDGIVTAVNVNPGDTYSGMGIATIEDVSKYVVRTEIDEYDIGKIKLGQKVKIKTNGTGDEILDGTVTFIAPRATLTSVSGVTYSVEVTINTKNDMLRLDMTAKLSIILESVTNVLTVPYDAVYIDEEDGRSYVEVVDGRDDNGRITHKVYVKTGVANDYYVEIKSDELKEDTEIAVNRENSDVFDFASFFERNRALGGM